MPQFLDLPPEVRIVIYHALIDSAVSERKRVAWMPDVLEKEISEKSTLVVSPRTLDWSAQQHGSHHFYANNCPALHHLDTGSVASLARTCELLREEIRPIAWKRADVVVQGRLPIIHALLETRFATTTMPSETKPFVQGLKLELDAGKYMQPGDFMIVLKKIIYFVTRHLPSLKTLSISLPFGLTKRASIARARPIRFDKSVRAVFECFAPLSLRVAVNYTAHPIHQVLPYVMNPVHDKFFKDHIQKIGDSYNKILVKARNRLLRRKEKNAIAGGPYTDALEQTLSLRSLSLG